MTDGHRAFVAGLPAATRAGLAETADAPGLIRLGAHAGLILGLGGLIAAGVPGWWALMLPQGILLAFLFNLQHECTHATPFRTRWLNEAVGHATGALILQPFLWFRAFHLAHHRHTGDPRRDPELLGRPKPETRLAYAVHVLGPLYWWDKLRVLGAAAAGGPEGDYIPPRAVPRIVREARILGALLAGVPLVVALVTPLPLFVWLVPLILGTPALRLYHLAEHGLCPAVSDVLRNTRTVATGPVVRFVTWNMPYHAEHHTLPAVPFHRLPALHDLMRDRLEVTAPGYAAFTAEYASQLRPRAQNAARST